MVLISKFYDYYILKRMRDTIEYCALRYTPVHISNCGDLVFNELNRVLPPEYQISKSEEKYVDEIYSKYRVHIMKSFFMASEFSWRTSHMRHEEYFFAPSVNFCTITNANNMHLKPNVSISFDSNNQLQNYIR